MNQKIKTKTSPTSGPKKSEWLAENLRFTAFTKKTEGSEKWWNLVMPESHTQIITTPYRGESGKFKKGLVQLNIQVAQPELQRIDWLYIPESQQLNSKDLPNVGSLDEAVYDFLPVMEKWLSTAKIKINRLAFGAVLIHPVVNKEDGYKYISKYLNAVKLDPLNSLDFLYQINRPRIYWGKGIKGIRINRVSKWMVAVLQRIEIAFNGQILSALPAENVQQTACRLEIDINTNPDVRILPKEKIKSILEEIVSIGIEITEKGDVK